MSRGRDKGAVGQRHGETDLANPSGSEDLEGAGFAAAPRLERYLCLSPCPWPAWGVVGDPVRDQEAKILLSGRGLNATMQVSLMFGVPQGQRPGPHS